MIPVSARQKPCWHASGPSDRHIHCDTVVLLSFCRHVCSALLDLGKALPTQCEDLVQSLPTPSLEALLVIHWPTETLEAVKDMLQVSEVS